MRWVVVWQNASSRAEGGFVWELHGAGGAVWW